MCNMNNADRLAEIKTEVAANLGNDEKLAVLFQEAADLTHEMAAASAAAKYEALTPAQRRENEAADFAQCRAVNRFARRTRLDAQGRPVVR